MLPFPKSGGTSHLVLGRFSQTFWDRTTLRQPLLLYDIVRQGRFKFSAPLTVHGKLFTVRL